MDVATIAATVAVTVSIIGGLVSGYASIRQRRTEDSVAVMSAMRDHMATLSEENKDLRIRVFTAEQHVLDLTSAVNRCESDKVQLARQLDALQKRVNGT
jgi:uncharacterized protein YlxW (UPF0749 family)